MKRELFYIPMAALLFLSLPLQAEDPEVMQKVSEMAKAEKNEESKSFFTPNYTFWNTSVNYLDWSSGTEQRAKGKTNFSDFVYLELEGGAGWDWGEFYFFADLENPTKSWDNEPTDDRRFVIKPILDVKLGETGFYFHLQDYFLKSKTFFVNNLVPGIAYKYSTDFGFWIRPFIGSHFQESTFYDGFNGWMAGWVFAYDFKISDQKFSLTNWHEFEWGRDDEHYLFEGYPVGDGRSHGVQGAVALWWTPMKEITAGVQYRYSNYKLGLDAYAAAVIYSLKYNF